jgi:iron complex transport system ATP-binding protein
MVLSASHLHFRYRGRPGDESAFALDDVSLTVNSGDLIGLLGPNGCGKTTLLALLAGGRRPDRGHIELAGRALVEIPRRELARTIAVVPQETHPAFDYTVIEMVLMGRHPHLGLFQVEGPADLAIAADALAATGTAHLADRPFMTLSGGEKQRVIIAAALAQSSRILLLDEPTASLDVGYELEIAALLTELNRSRAMTMVLATHDLNLAASVCSTLVLMRRGRIIAHGQPRDVLTAAAIREVYGVEAEVAFHERAGHLSVVPVGRA